MEDVNSWLRGIHKFHKNWATTKSTDSTVIFQALLYHFNATLKRGITQLLFWKKYWLCSFKILAVTLSHYILVWKRLIFWPYSLNLPPPWPDLYTRWQEHLQFPRTQALDGPVKTAGCPHIDAASQISWLLLYASPQILPVNCSIKFESDSHTGKLMDHHLIW